MSEVQSTVENADESHLNQKSANEFPEQPTPPSADQNTSSVQSRNIRRKVKKRKHKFVLPTTCLQQKTYDDVCRTQWMTSVVKEYLDGVNLRNATCEQMTAHLTASHKRYKRRYLQQQRQSAQAQNHVHAVDIQATSSTAKDGVECIKEELRRLFEANTVSEELKFSDLTKERDTNEAATLLRIIRELASTDFIEVEQSGVCENITIRKGSNFV